MDRTRTYPLFAAMPDGPAACAQLATDRRGPDRAQNVSRPCSGMATRAPVFCDEVAKHPDRSGGEWTDS